MKTLKSFIFAVMLVALALPAFAQTTYRNTFVAQSVDSTTSRTDTSTTVTTGGYPNISVLTTSAGTDSLQMTVYVDVLLNGTWFISVASGALQLGNPALHIPEASGKGQNSTLILRDNGRIADLLQEATQIRIRNVITGGGYFPAKTRSYTQSVVLRKW
jgi:hypothetical protein